MRKSIRHMLLGRFLPLLTVIGISFAAPPFAWGSGSGNQGNQGNQNQGNGPTIPEPSAWLAMGAGLLVFGSYVRSRTRTPR